MDRLAKRMEAQKLEADRTGELQRLQERQKRESRRRAEQQASRRAAPPPGRGTSAHPDLQDLDFGSISSSGHNSRLPAPMRPDENDDYRGGSLSDFSDYDYDSSDAEYQAQARSRRQSMAGGQRGQGKRQSMDYKRFDDDGGSRGLLSDPFGDPDTPVNERQRMQCESDCLSDGRIELMRTGAEI